MYLFIEYFTWKDEQERNGNVSFFISHLKVLQNGLKKTYLRCHRSGTCNSTAWLRAPKSQGTCKIGKNCPATIEMIEDAECIKVIYFKTHVGHDFDMKHIRVKEFEKENLRSTYYFLRTVLQSFFFLF